MDDAQRAMDRAEQELRAFGRELADVQMYADIQLRFDSFTRFFDTFCDNFFVDWMVQSQILQAQDRVGGGPATGLGSRAAAAIFAGGARACPHPALYMTRREAPAPGAVRPCKSPTTAKPPFPGSREWGLETVEKPSGFFRRKGLRSAARIICPSVTDKFHTGSPSCIFSHAHVARENDFISLPPSGGKLCEAFLTR